MRTRLFSIMMAALCGGGAMAENLLEIVPQRIEAGSTSADWRYFTMQMNNDEVFTAFQFDLYLPEGVDLDDSAPVDLSTDRFPYTAGRYGPTFTHVISAVKHDGFWRVIIYSTQNEPIGGNSGDLLYLNYVSDADLPSGPMPLEIRNVVMAISGTQDVKPADCSSYLYTADFDGATATRLDLSGLKGYVPRDVVEATNTLTDGNDALTEIDLSGADDAGAAFTAANPNCLRYVKQGSALAKTLASEANVVTKGDDGNACERYILTDGHAASVSTPFIAATATYSRTVPAAGWYSLCLPFAPAVPDGVTVERYTSIDVAAGTITFTEGAPEAGVPCIFRTEGTAIELSADNAEVAVTTDAPADAALTGTYSGVEAGGIEGCYALFADGSGFGRAGQTASVPPFRAYLNSTGNAATMRLIHGGADGITETEAEGLRLMPGNSLLTIAAGDRRHDVTVCAADGRTVGRITLSPHEQRTLALAPGLYIVNKTKIAIRQ